MSKLSFIRVHLIELWPIVYEVVFLSGKITLNLCQNKIFYSNNMRFWRRNNEITYARGLLLLGIKAHNVPLCEN